MGFITTIGLGFCIAGAVTGLARLAGLLVGVEGLPDINTVIALIIYAGAIIFITGMLTERD